MLPGISMAALALANDINANQLARWCREHQRADNVAEGMTLVPVNVVGHTASEFMPALPPPPLPGEIEWRHGNASLIVRGNVDAEILRTIISQTLASSRAA
jgi:hypothetical protein